MASRYIVTCDKCGKEIQYAYSQEVAMKLTTRWNRDGQISEKSYDFCRECAEVVKRMLETQQEGGESE